MDTRSFDKKAKQWLLVNQSTLGGTFRLILAIMVIVAAWEFLYNFGEVNPFEASRTVQEVIQLEAARFAMWTVALSIFNRLINPKR